MGGRGAESKISANRKSSSKSEDKIASVFDNASPTRILKKDFFGQVVKATNKYYRFDQVLSDDKIIIVSRDVVSIKGKPVYVTGSNTAIYLKDWQFRRMATRHGGGDMWAIKLDRNYFKEYTFKNPIRDSEGFNFHKKQENFDSLRKVAREQQEWQLKGGSFRSDGTNLILWNRIEKL